MIGTLENSPFQMSHQVEESESTGRHHRNKIQELENILIAAGPYKSAPSFKLHFFINFKTWGPSLSFAILIELVNSRRKFWNWLSLYLECFLLLGEERQDLLNEIEDKKTKIRQVEQRNLLILNEAEEQRQDLENQLARFTSDQNYISSPVSANLFNAWFPSWIILNCPVILKLIFRDLEISATDIRSIIFA